ncbi:MAG: polyprenyl synthetase family protein [Clostridia bacterium]|nr:polyprenyl synthetase family protein [Clostridia bacterium]
MSTVKEALADAYAWKSDDLGNIKARMKAVIRAADAHSDMNALLIDSIDHSGKMLRPFLLLMVAGDCTDKQHDKLLWSAAAGEMLHIASLLLDDIIDEADIRREVFNWSMLTLIGNRV